MFCPNCGNQVEDSSRFCGFCGNRFEAAQPDFVEENEPTMAYDQDDNDAFFVQEDGSGFPYPQQAPVAQPAKRKTGLKLPAKLPVKWLALGAGALAVLILLIVVISAFAGGGQDSYALYLKDEEMMFSDLSGDPMQISERLVSGFGDMDNEELAGGASSISNLIYLTEDGNRIFYPDRIGPDNDSSEGYTIYYRNPNKPKQEPEKLDSGITQYYATKDGDKVVYLKNDSLYLHDLKEREKIDSDVKDFWVNEDASVIYYIDLDGTLYVKDGKADKEKVDRDVSSLNYMGDKGELIIYEKEDTVYRKELGKDKEKLISADGYITEFAGDGNFFYVEYADMSILDFINYDVEETYWKEDLADIDVSLRTLYYFEGTEKNLVMENVLTLVYSYTGNSNTLIAIQANPDDAGKVKMSDIVTAYYESYTSVGSVAQDMVEQMLSEDAATFLTVETTVSEFEYEDVESMQLSEDGKTMYFLADYDSDDNSGTLYKASISGGKLGKVEELDDEVYDNYWTAYVYNGMLAYYKDVDDGMGDLYINGEEVDYDVRTGSLRHQEGSRDYYYISDWDSDRGEGTLKHYSGGDPETIAEDVRSAVLAAGGDLLYLQDYSTNSYKGDLYCYNGRKSVMIDEDVVALLSVYYGYHYAYGM